MTRFSLLSLGLKNSNRCDIASALAIDTERKRAVASSIDFLVCPMHSRLFIRCCFCCVVPPSKICIFVCINSFVVGELDSCVFVCVCV